LLALPVVRGISAAVLITGVTTGCGDGEAHGRNVAPAASLRPRAASPGIRADASSRLKLDQDRDGNTNPRGDSWPRGQVLTGRCPSRRFLSVVYLTPPEIGPADLPPCAQAVTARTDGRPPQRVGDTGATPPGAALTIAPSRPADQETRA
jgi:hypothetical protein